MRRGGWRILLVVMMLGGTVGVHVGVATGVSTGQATDPVRIETWHDLDDIRNDRDGNYILVNDLNASTPGYSEIASPQANNGAGFDPIAGTGVSSFRGSLDGNGHTISDLYINRPDSSNIGLFTENQGQITNLSIRNATVIGGDNTGTVAGKNLGSVHNVFVEATVSGGKLVGGVIGSQSGGGTNLGPPVKNVTADVNVSGWKRVGGLIGYANVVMIADVRTTGNVSGSLSVGGVIGEHDARGQLIRATSTASVHGTVNVGGLVGLNQDKARIVNSRAAGSVFGGGDVGGLVGLNWGGRIIESVATGDVILVSNGSSFAAVNDRFGQVIGNTAGGLVGHNDVRPTDIRAKIKRSKATGNVTGSVKYMGGLVGKNEGDRASVRNSTATGTVIKDASYAALDAVGGVTGQNGGTISDVYVTGNMTVTSPQFAGGLVGRNNGNVRTAYTLTNITVRGSKNDVGPAYGYNPGTETNTYWNINTTGEKSDSQGGVGLTTAEMRGLTATKTMDGFDFTATWRAVTDPAGYPVLRTTPSTPISRITLLPVNRSAVVNETVTYRIVGLNLSTGVASYNITIALANTSVASITEVTGNGEIQDIALGIRSVRITGRNVRVDGTGRGAIAQVMIRGTASGVTNLTVTNLVLTDRSGHTYEINRSPDAVLSVTPVLPGDVNDDGSVGPSDAGLVLRYVVGLETPDSINLRAADMNGDGEITSYDATLILQKVVGLR